MSPQFLPYRPGTDEFPSPETTLLPSRAVLRSWVTQTVPARRFSIEDAVSHFEDLDGGEPGLRDMAVLAAISESMQALEDLAYLGTGWDTPFQGLPYYVRTITFGKNVPNDFWTQVSKWEDDRVAVFAGLHGRDPDTGQLVDLLDGVDALTGLSPEHAAALTAAREATVRRVREVLDGLRRDWLQFSSYFLAFKHGGLAINRSDVAFVGDDVREVTATTRTHDPSIAVWTRGKRAQQLQADLQLTQAEVVGAASSAGRLAVRCVEAFVEARLATVDSVEFSDDGEVIGLHPLQMPWTHWLREEDLDEESWQLVGRGPILRWIDEPPESPSTASEGEADPGAAHADGS